MGEYVSVVGPSFQEAPLSSLSLDYGRKQWPEKVLLLI